jgi:hypothetical protein
VSYLDVPRIHFAGEFQSDPSTIDNKIGSCCGGDAAVPPTDCNYNLATVITGRPEQQLWNPTGRHYFILRSCTVRRGVTSAGQVRARPDQDPLVSGAVAVNSLARLVDLDPSWQTSSQIWGLELAVTLSGAASGFSGTMTTGTLRELWPARAPAPPPLATPDPSRFREGARFGGVYQSVLTNVQWNPDVGPSASPILEELRRVSANRLSIKFVLYAYDGDPGSPRGSNGNFTIGRIVGTIGPALAGEPDHVPNARALINAVTGGDPFGTAPFKVDAARRKLIVDLGNAIPEATAGGARRAIGTLTAQIDLPPPQTSITLGTLTYDQAHYLETAGVEEIDLSATQVGQIAVRPLRLRASAVSGRLVLAERATGVHVDVTQTAVRLNPTESVALEFLATRFGTPVSGVDVTIAVMRGTPASAVTVASTAGVIPAPVALPGSVRTLATGRAPFRITAGDPAHPRAHVDGQVFILGFFVGPVVAANLRGTIAVRIFDSLTVPANPRLADVRDLLNQYARLYPSMTAVIDLSNHTRVQATRGVLAGAVRRPETAGNYMPVSRDLSRDRKALLLRWLDAGAPP